MCARRPGKAFARGRRAFLTYSANLDAILAISHLPSAEYRCVPLTSANAKAACITFLLISALHSSIRSQDSASQTASDDVYEAVVRFQITSWDLAAHSYCISINGHNASQQFLARFDSLPVKTASGCHKQTTQKVVMSIVDKAGKHSVIFDVGSIRWLKENQEAEVDGGYWCGGLCSAGGVYHVLRDGTHWKVTGFEASVIS